MQFSNDGLTIWYDTSDAPLAPRCVIVGVRPAHSANSVTIQYRSGGGFIRSLAASPVTDVSGSGDQYFRAQLPATPDEGDLEILPILRCSGRQVPSAPAASGDSPAWRELPPAPAPPAVAPLVRPIVGPRFSGRMDFLGTVTANLKKPPETVGLTPQGLRKNFYIESGSCVGPRLNATIRPGGGDWLLIQRDGVGWPSVRTTWETRDGAILFTDYYGVFDLGENGFANALEEKYPDRPTVHLAPRFATAHPDYLWINRLQCVGIGHVDMAKLQVGYDLYALKGGEFEDKEGAT